MIESPRPRHVRDKPIAALVDVIPESRVHGDGAALVRGITHDSRHVVPGDVYLARAGEHTHGIAHVDEAVRAGAVAVLTDRASVARGVDAGVSAVVEVDDPRPVAGVAAAWVYDNPTDSMRVLGITGTNGKTTTAYLAEAGLQAAGHVTGLVGTVETRVGDLALPSVRTTPEATDLQGLFALMREHGADAVAMEVSSHALALDRIVGTRFAVAAFTNLSQDHLDFHRDLEDYFAAKAQLFRAALADSAVVLVEDDWGRRLAASVDIPLTTIGSADADWTILPLEREALRLRGPDGAEHRIEVGLPGAFNLRNAALAYVALLELGVPAEAARDGIAAVRAVPGRMERIVAGQPFTVLVDYAHTPDAVRLLLTEARDLAGDGGRVVVVLGCGGDRDRDKRPQMGAAAAEGADVAVLTSDNPRSEDPGTILEAMLAGVGPGARATVVVDADRHSAIDQSIGLARDGDVVVIAGKGHEQGQEFAGETIPFDDRSVVRQALAAHGYGTAT